MKLESLELLRASLPLVSPFRTSFGTQTTRQVLLVHVTTAESEGWAECVALEEPVATYLPEFNNDNISVKLPDGSLKIGYGARVGLLSESIIVPGVSLSFMRPSAEGFMSFSMYAL